MKTNERQSIAVSLQNWASRMHLSFHKKLLEFIRGVIRFHCHASLQFRNTMLRHLFGPFSAGLWRKWPNLTPNYTLNHHHHHHNNNRSKTAPTYILAILYLCRIYKNWTGSNNSNVNRWVHDFPDCWTSTQTEYTTSKPNQKVFLHSSTPLSLCLCLSLSVSLKQNP